MRGPLCWTIALVLIDANDASPSATLRLGQRRPPASVPASSSARSTPATIPSGELEQERAAATINELADRYVAEHLPRKRPRSRIEDERLLPIIRAALGREKVPPLPTPTSTGCTEPSQRARAIPRQPRAGAALQDVSSRGQVAHAARQPVSSASSETLSRSASGFRPSQRSSACSDALAAERRHPGRRRHPCCCC